jgi:hypothetical protein
MGVPTAETPPPGLNAYWLGVWRHVLKVLKEQKTWAWEQRPLVDEYVFALKAAEEARRGFDWLDALEKYADENAHELEMPDFRALAQIATGLPGMWDRHSKRASALADQLALTPRGRKPLRLKTSEEGEDGESKDPFAGLDDEFTRKREAKAS